MPPNSPLESLLRDAASCQDCVKLMRLARNWAKLRAEARPSFAHAKRLAILCGATSETYTPLLEICAASRGLFLETWQAPFGTWRQQILDTHSALHAFRPEVVLLHLTQADFTRWPALHAKPDDAARAAEEEAREILNACETIRKRHAAPVLLANFHLPPHDSLSNLAAQLPASRSLHVQRVNLALAHHAPAGITLLDVAGMSARFGVQRWLDPVAWAHSKQPMSFDAMTIFSQTLAAVTASLWLGAAKCIVLDLDNTLWGGVVADDGLEGIRVGQGSAEGEAYLEFQRFLLDLRRRGILLAACSKNQEATARAVFEEHADMMIRSSDFSAFVANFSPKADNVRAIARSLNLGLDAMVFVDDNPAEREQMRQLAPLVRVVDLPQDPGQYVAALAASLHFEAATLTPEDLDRAGAYAANHKRAELASQATDLGEFLKSLDMRAVLAPYNAQDIPRVTQLINKSNQFNLRTQRHTQEEIEAFAADPSRITLSIRLQDSFGDNGLISAIHGTVRDGHLNLETWVMSCRVLDRTVEQVAVNRLAEEAKKRGVAALRGSYIPTPKNELVKEHYKKLGFKQVEEKPGGETVWELDLKNFVPFRCPIQC